MQAMVGADPASAAEIGDAFNHWDDIELIFKDREQRTTGHGFIGIGRKQLLNILQRRCEQLGVELAFDREVDSDLEFPDADLVIASDGINSKIRERYADVFKPDLAVRPNRYIWLGTRKLFDAFTFDFRRSDGRCRARVRGDDLRVARRAHHPGLPGTVERRAGGGLETFG